MPDFTLAPRWMPAAGDEACRYVLDLRNDGPSAIQAFQLAISGPARVDATMDPEGGRLVTRLSNHAVIAAPEGFVLEPGAHWAPVVRGLSYPLRHWSDATHAAYLVLSDGSTAPVAVKPCRPEPDDGGAPLYEVAPEPLAPIGEPGLSVIPYPALVAVAGRQESLGLALAEPHAAFAGLVEALFPAEGLLAETGLQVVRHADPALGPEAYRLTFAPGSVRLDASADAGALYGLVTLGQIVLGARRHPERFVVPETGTIEDAPEHGWRGCHLDVCRNFFPVPEVENLLHILAWNKLNRFHWHLTEDEAWRIEIDAHPELTEIGAWRGHGLPLPPLLGSGAERHGGFYSKQEARDLVALAASLGIVVVPEVDVPGHSHAALTALPWLRDRGENDQYFSIQGFPNNCLNPGVPATRTFMETVLGELIDLFPSPWIHVGADEVPEDAWSSSPAARERLRALGDTNLHHDLQADFLRHVHAFVRDRGRVTGAWEEGAFGGGISADRSLMFGWRNPEINRELASQGYDVVVTPGQRYYLDMAHGPQWWECGAGWAGSSSLAETYAFEPAKGWNAEERTHLAGIQACIWSESMDDRRLMRRLVFPRLSAIAETAWTPPHAKDFGRFSAVASLMPILEEGA